MKRVLFCVAALTAGCTGPADVQVRTRTITAADVEQRDLGSKLIIDTSDARDGFIFDQREGLIAYERIHLICPNGASMNMQQWLQHQADVAGVQVNAPQRIFVGQLVPPPPEDDACAEVCRECPDGLMICFDPCDDWSPPLAEESQRRDERPALGEGPTGAGPPPPEPPTPPDEEGGGTPPGNGDPNNGGRPGGEGSGSTGGSGSSGSGGSTGNPPGGGGGGGSQGGAGGGHGGAGGGGGHGGTGGTGGGGGGLF